MRERVSDCTPPVKTPRKRTWRFSPHGWFVHAAAAFHWCRSFCQICFENHPFGRRLSHNRYVAIPRLTRSRVERGPGHIGSRVCTTTRQNFAGPFWMIDRLWRFALVFSDDWRGRPLRVNTSTNVQAPPTTRDPGPSQAPHWTCD